MSRLKKIARRVWMHLRYGSYFAVKADGEWYVERYWLIFPYVDYEGPMTKREAEGIAALNNDSRGLL